MYSGLPALDSGNGHGHVFVTSHLLEVRILVVWLQETYFKVLVAMQATLVTWLNLTTNKPFVN